MDENLYAWGTRPENVPDRDEFSEDAVRSLQLSNWWAVQLNHPYIATHHLLLGITSNRSAHAQPVVRRHGVFETAVRASIETHDPEGPEMVLMGKLGQTQAVYDTLVEANRLRKLSEQALINSTHLLAALMKCGESIIDLILHDCGTDRNTLASAALESIGVTGTQASSDTRP